MNVWKRRSSIRPISCKDFIKYPVSLFIFSCHTVEEGLWTPWVNGDIIYRSAGLPGSTAKTQTISGSSSVTFWTGHKTRPTRGLHSWTEGWKQGRWHGRAEMRIKIIAERVRNKRSVAWKSPECQLTLWIIWSYVQDYIKTTTDLGSASPPLTSDLLTLRVYVQDVRSALSSPKDRGQL